MTPDTSLGFEVCDFARDVLGVELLPWQEWLFVHGLELKPDGNYRFRTVLVLVARQNGKTTALMVLALWRLVMDSARMVLGTSTNLDYARESWMKATELAWGPVGSKGFAGVPELEGEFMIPRYANGEQTLSTVDGRRYKIGTASRRGGRSLSVDLLILDELREHQTWDAWSASSKTTNARPRGQRWALSNMGDDNSVVLNHLQRQALKNLETGEGDDSLAIFEWSAPDRCNPFDRLVWPMANPALGHLIDEETIASDLATDPMPVFLTEVLCKRVPNLGPQPIDSVAWEELSVDRHRPRNTVPLFFIDMAGSRSAAISAVFPVKGVPHGELADHRPGTDWLVGRCAKLHKRFPNAIWGLEKQGAAGAKLPELLEIGIKPDEFTASDMGRACVHLETLVADKAFTHSPDERFLAALTNAVKRDIGEGLWAWSIRKSNCDLTPLNSISGALWLLETHGAYDLLESIH